MENQIIKFIYKRENVMVRISGIELKIDVIDKIFEIISELKNDNRNNLNEFFDEIKEYMESIGYEINIINPDIEIDLGRNL